MSTTHSQKKLVSSALENKLKKLALKYRSSLQDSQEVGPNLILYMPEGSEEKKEAFLKSLSNRIFGISDSNGLRCSIDLKEVPTSEILEHRLKDLMPLQNKITVINNFDYIQHISDMTQKNSLIEFLKSVTGKENTLNDLSFKDAIIVLKSNTPLNSDHDTSQLPALLNRIMNFGDYIELGDAPDSQIHKEDYKLVDSAMKELKGRGLPKSLENTTRSIINENLEIPVKILGIGAGGVGKSTLTKSIFSLNNKSEPSKELLKRSNINVGNTDFQRVTIQDPSGVKVLLSDSPGFGRDRYDDINILLPKVVEEAKSHDLIYWVLETSSYRGTVAYTKMMMEELSNAMKSEKIKFEEKLVVVINKIDEIKLSPEEQAQGLVAWDDYYNILTHEALPYAKELVKLVEEDFKSFGIRSDQIIYCNAETGYRTDLVFDKFIELLPKEKRMLLFLNGEFAYSKKNKAAQKAHFSINNRRDPVKGYDKQKTSTEILKRAERSEPKFIPDELQDLTNQATQHIEYNKKIRQHEIRHSIKEMAAKEYEEFIERDKLRQKEKKKSKWDWLVDIFVNKIQPILPVVIPTLIQIVDTISKSKPSTTGSQNKSSINAVLQQFFGQ